MGINPKIKIYYGCALSYAALGRFLPIVWYLIEKANFPTNTNNGQALFFAVWDGRAEVVKYLLDLRSFDYYQCEMALDLPLKDSVNRLIKDHLEKIRSEIISKWGKSILFIR